MIPCAVLAAVAHPGTNHPLVFRVRPSPSQPPAASPAFTPIIAMHVMYKGWDTYNRMSSSKAAQLSGARCRLGNRKRHPLLRWLPLPQIMWALCVYLEAVSVLPQLRMMQVLSLLRLQMSCILWMIWRSCSAIHQASVGTAMRYERTLLDVIDLVRCCLRCVLCWRNKSCTQFRLSV